MNLQILGSPSLTGVEIHRFQFVGNLEDFEKLLDTDAPTVRVRIESEC